MKDKEKDMSNMPASSSMSSRNDKTTYYHFICSPDTYDFFSKNSLCTNIFLKYVQGQNPSCYIENEEVIQKTTCSINIEKQTITNSTEKYLETKKFMQINPTLIKPFQNIEEIVEKIIDYILKKTSFTISPQHSSFSDTSSPKKQKKDSPPVLNQNSFAIWRVMNHSYFIWSMDFQENGEEKRLFIRSSPNLDIPLGLPLSSSFSSKKLPAAMERQQPPSLEFAILNLTSPSHILSTFSDGNSYSDSFNSNILQIKKQNGQISKLPNSSFQPIPQNLLEEKNSDSLTRYRVVTSLTKSSFFNLGQKILRWQQRNKKTSSLVDTSRRFTLPFTKRKKDPPPSLSSPTCSISITNNKPTQWVMTNKHILTFSLPFEEHIADEKPKPKEIFILCSNLLSSEDENKLQYAIIDSNNIDNELEDPSSHYILLDKQKNTKSLPRSIFTDISPDITKKIFGKKIFPQKRYSITPQQFSLLASELFIQKLGAKNVLFPPPPPPPRTFSSAPINKTPSICIEMPSLPSTYLPADDSFAHNNPLYQQPSATTLRNRVTTYVRDNKKLFSLIAGVVLCIAAGSTTIAILAHQMSSKPS